ncbi:hypothetical protein [Janthinobacterium sp. RB2P8]|uniref:hypothetical protein n=1 Tax=Janthinobacterium sp. RB2P8 TaxID=3424191 RepID=UPI003F2522BA
MKNGRYEEERTICWYLNDKRHREDGPAIESANGTKEWFINGKYHREDGPAVELEDGTKHWWINGKLHREDGPAVEWAAGDKSWYLNGKRHREDGPAIESPNGDKEWWVNGLRHREDGPACIYKDPDENDFFYEWFRYGERVSEEEIEQIIVKKELNRKLHTTLKSKPTQKRSKI